MKYEFYICSFGGCGSWMLAQYLSRYGDVTHIHSRNPPDILQRADCESKHFINEFKSPRNVHVIYIYRDPVKAMHSVERRHDIKAHCKNIECSESNVFGMCLLNEDVFGLEEFFDNYTMTKRRNYNIVCVKYETLELNMQRLNVALGIIDNPQFYPIFKETPVETPEVKVFDRLRLKMNNMLPIMLI